MNTQYQTATVIFATLDGDAIKWPLPVAAGTAVERVHAEVRARLAADPNVNLESVQVVYPAGPWTEPMDRDAQIIGGGVPPLQTQHAAQAAQPLAPPARPPENPMTAPLSYLGPLPDASAGQRPRDPGKDLSELLAAWAARHQLSSAEYYLLLASAQIQHAQKLYQASRPTR